MLMLSTILLALLSPGSDIIGRVVKEYRAVESYHVTLRAQSGTTSEVIRYYYKRPGYVRMEFVKPHKGAVLIYDPHEKEVTLRPFGFLKPLVLNLRPGNRLVKSSRGHRVDQSDIGFLLGFVKELASDGAVEVVGEEAVNGREAIHVRVKGKAGVVVGGEINRYSLWLDKSLLLPIKVISYDSDGTVIEEVLMDDLEIDVGLTDEFFSF
jgi:outer membrane lipoprotein-sorting protein